MTKRTLKIVLSIVLFSILISSLMYFNVRKLATKHQGTFKRNLRQNAIQIKDILDLSINSYYLSGVSGENIYLGNLTGTNNLLILNSTTHKRQNISISLKGHKIDYRALVLSVDSPDLMFYERLKHATLTSTLAKPTSFEERNIQTYLSKFQIISKNSIAGVIFDPKMKISKIIKINTASSIQQSKPYPIEKQVDGYFCSSGDLIRSGDRLIYTFYHRNQFICLDTNLVELYKGNTIDTNTIAKIQISKINSDQSRTFSSPPLYVNTSSSANNDFLFIHSKIPGINEEATTFEDHTAIDVYDLKTGKYNCSFYLPVFKGKKMRSFKVTGNQLYTFQGNYLLIYNLKLH